MITLIIISVSLDVYYTRPQKRHNTTSVRTHIGRQIFLTVR